MRITLAGPHLGPLRTTLWSWSPGRHHAPRRLRPVTPRRRRVWPRALAVLLLIGGIGKAYQASVWLGILVTVLIVAVAALAVYGLFITAKGTVK